MKTPAPTLSPLLRSDLQGELLAILLLDPGAEHSLTDLARVTGVSVSRVHHEVNRLTAASLLSERRVGATRLVRANTDNPLAQPLTELIELTYGPPVVLSQALAGVPGVVSAFVYGSWAARRSGEEGPPPADVDVLVVGDTPRSELQMAADRAERTLRRPVNIQRVALQDWDDEVSAFVRQLKSQPLVELDLEG